MDLSTMRVVKVIESFLGKRIVLEDMFAGFLIGFKKKTRMVPKRLLTAH
jgi:hypothetical protein